MTQWIFESPDGGKTVTRRPFGKPNDEKEWLFRANVGSIDNRDEIWTPKNTIEKIMENAYYESLIREKYPAVREAYEQYQALLEICRQQEIGV